MSIVQSDWTGRIAKHAALFFPSEQQKPADPSGQWDRLGGIRVRCLTYLALPSCFPDSVNRAQAAKPETAVDRSNAVPRRKKENGLFFRILDNSY